MKAWFTAAELADLQLPGLPATKRNINETAARDEWQWRPREGRGGGREYHVAALPEAARVELARRAQAEAAATLATFEGRAAVALDGSLAGLVGAKRDRAEVRLVVVNQFNQFHQDSKPLPLQQAMRLFVAGWNAGAIPAPGWLREAMPTLSERSVWRWRATVMEGKGAQLAGCYKARREQGVIEGDPAMRDFIAAFLLHRTHVNAHHVLKGLAARFPDRRLPSLRRLRAWIERWKRDNAAMLARAENPDRAKIRLPAFGSMSEGIVRINQVWELDATPADVMCVDGRYVVVGVIDVATRRAKVLVVKTSKATAVTALLARAIDAWGMPELAKSDNGADFVSRHVTRGLAQLRIAHKTCPPFTPECKPHIERFFGTMTRDLFELQPGYSGHNVADAQALRAIMTYAKRLGEGDDVAFKVTLTAKQLQERCDAWLAADYERREHSGIGTSPFAMAARLAHGVRRVADPRLLDVLLAEAPGDGGYRTVGKKGIRVDGQVFTAAELGTWVGEHVQVKYDPADLGRIVVYDSDGKFICVAIDDAMQGESRAAVAAQATALAKVKIRAERVYRRELAKVQRPDLVTEEIAAHQAREATKIVAFPAAGQTVNVPGLEEAARAARALADPASMQPRPSYLDLPAAGGLEQSAPERQNAPAEVIAFTPADPDPWPGWVAETIEIWEWAQRNPTRAPEDLTVAEFHARIESWRAEDGVLDFWITQRQRQQTA